MKSITVAALLAIATIPAHAYTSLEELLDDSNRQQVEALKAYIAANPEADDLAEARERLVYGLVALDDYGAAIDLLDARYKELPADKSQLDLSVAFGEIVAPLIQRYRLDGRKEDGLAFIASVRADFKDHDMAETINEALDEFSGMFAAPGPGEVLDLAFTALDGTAINLADYHGKVVLVDFWATWCVPCLKAMPGLKAAYAEFRERGFEIIGISLDDDKDKFTSYLEKEGITWPQFFDGKGWENEFATKLGIEAIPATFLIGPDGTIIATDPTESALKATLAELLPAPEMP